MRVIEIITPGPQGSVGPAGPTGSIDTSSFVTTAQTSSFVLNSQTSSMSVATASYVVNGAPIVSIGNGTAVTGTTNNTFSKAILIPANSRTSGQSPMVVARVAKTGTAGTVISRVYWNITPDISGSPILLATSATNAGTTRSYTLYRMLSIDVANGTGNGTVSHGTTLSSNNDNGPFAGAISTGVAVDWTQAGYIVVAIANASTADSSVCNLIKLEI